MSGWSPAASERFRRWALWGASRGPERFVRYSPPLIGLAFCAALPEARRRILRNLRRVHGRRGPLDEARDVARTFSSFAACLAESLGSDRPEAHDPVRSVRGAERLQAAMDAGRGVLVATAHIGPWDGAARALALHTGHSVLVVMGPEPNRQAQQLHDSVRGREGVEILRLGEHPLDALPVLTRLREEGVVAFQFDRPATGGDALQVEVLGAPLLVPRGPFILSAMTGAPILPVFASREGYFDYRVDIGHPVRVSSRRDEAEILNGANRIASQMSEFLASHPTQWFHFGEDP